MPRKFHPLTGASPDYDAGICAATEIQDILTHPVPGPVGMVAHAGDYPC